jgi:hypothetical protein
MKFITVKILAIIAFLFQKRETLPDSSFRSVSWEAGERPQRLEEVHLCIPSLSSTWHAGLRVVITD